MADIMSQHAPYPRELAVLVSQLSYRESEGWKAWLEDMCERDPGSRGLTLIVQRCGPDSYHPERMIRVNHYFPVPPATYDRRSWTWWLFEDVIGQVELHERMENFRIGGKTIYPPAHGPGNNPYLVLHYGTDADRRTSFRGGAEPAVSGQVTPAGEGAQGLPQIGLGGTGGDPDIPECPLCYACGGGGHGGSCPNGGEPPDLWAYDLPPGLQRPPRWPRRG